MDIAFGQVSNNFQKVEELVKIAMKDEPDVIVLPELWTTGYDLTRLTDIADKEATETTQFLQRLAQTHGVHLVGGSVASQTEQGIFNSMLIVNNQGELVHTYAKAHLFKLMDEHLYLTSGNDSSLFSLDQQLFAGFICYDIRFPEWIRKATSAGAKVIFVVAEWPLPRLVHWRTLLSARAIENQCYVIACNRAGTDPNNQFAGHSMIIDPWGEVIAEGNEQEEIITAAIELSEVDRVRSLIPIFADRREDLY